MLYLLVFMTGASLGSFVGVVAERLPLGESFVQGRSHCRACGRTLSASDLLPLWSYLRRRGQCRYCGAPIGVRSLIQELAGGALAVATVLVYGFCPTAAAVMALLTGLLAVFFIDWDTMLIPDGLILYLLLPALALLWLLPQAGLTEHLLGAVSVSLPLLLLALLIPDSFGGGDIKLTAVCGLALGWKLMLLAFFLALLPAGAYGGYLLAKKRGRGVHIPFGPALCGGVAAALLAGRPLLAWYMGLLS